MNTSNLQIRYTSQPIKIEKTLWRLVIKECAAQRDFEEDRKQLCTEYQWNAEGQWYPGSAWPAYNINDTYFGMPRRLSRLYDREKKRLIFLSMESRLYKRAFLSEFFGIRTVWYCNKNRLLDYKIVGE
jgi:hypothetical protein